MAEDKYEYSKIATFRHWSLYLHENQCYLGRMVIWSHREEFIDFVDLPIEEVGELMEIGRKAKAALTELFKPDLFNWASLANETKHQHMHLIPRYESQREFGGVTFKDERWGAIYAPYNREFTIPSEVFQALKTKIQEAIS